jgi:hypothetical protein
MRLAYYAQAAEQMIPVLHPDLVIVAVLQGDDLAQALEAAPDAAGASPRPASFPKRVTQSLVRVVAPNLL